MILFMFMMEQIEAHLLCDCKRKRYWRYTTSKSVTCTSGYMFLVWHSDVSIVDSGFDVRWTSVIAPSLTPTAAFSIGIIILPLSSRSFYKYYVDSTTGCYGIR